MNAKDVDKETVGDVNGSICSATGDKAYLFRDLVDKDSDGAVLAGSHK